MLPDSFFILRLLGLPIFASRLVYTHNFGETWLKSKVYDSEGNPLDGDSLPFKVMSDRVQADIFYGFSDHTNGYSGMIRGTYGFYRSHDGGVTWKRINDDQHQYGDIRSITGDPRVFGRIYVATGTRGIVYGDIIWEE